MIERGEGIYLWDESGRRYIDGSGGPLVINVGHGRQEIAEAIALQAQKAAYVHATMFTSEPVERYASELAKIVPLPEPRFYFLSSGSEAVEASIKLARQIQQARGEPDRILTIGRWQSYHGLSFGALSVSGRESMRDPYAGMFLDMPHIDPPYTYRRSESGLSAANRLEEMILSLGAKKVSAFIAEPISGASLGAAAPPDDYWPRIRQICDQYGVLMIVDEVIVGMGRTGKWWGIDHWSVEPDVLVASKGIAGGYFPLGLVAAKGEDVAQISRTLGDFNHGGTFSHHALGAAAGLATLDIMKREKLVENSANMGGHLGKRLYQALTEHPHVGDIRGRGLFWGVELVSDRDTKRPFPAGDHVATNIWQRAFDKGLITYYSQGCADDGNGDIIMLGPPLISRESQIDEMVDILGSAIEEELGE
jgi:adenosylmethionine-8-amino-7-oxononanoate aminotransferase